MDQKLQEHLYEAGIDCADGLGRMNGSEALFAKLLAKFPKDENYQNFRMNLAEGRWEEAKRNIHALKGLSANMGMKQLYRECVETEMQLKQDAPPENLAQLDRNYQNIVMVIQREF